MPAQQVENGGGLVNVIRATPPAAALGVAYPHINESPPNDAHHNLREAK